MSKIKHTSGPWGSLDLRPKQEQITIVSIPGKVVIARIKNEISGKKLTEIDEANAILILNSLEMLAALKEAMNVFTMLDIEGLFERIPYTEARNKVQDAILAAEGKFRG